MSVYRLGPDREQPDSCNGAPTIPEGNSLVLDYLETRRQCLIQELRYVEGQLVEAGRIKRLTVAPPRLR